MTGPKGNSKFCFLANCNFHQGNVDQNILVKGKQNLLFPVKAVIKCFVTITIFVSAKSQLLDAD